MFDTQFRGQFLGAQEAVGLGDGVLTQLGLEAFQVEGQVLDSALAELDVGVAEPFGGGGCVAAGDCQHFVGHVHADVAAVEPHDLGGDEADLARAATQVEHRLARLEMARGNAAAIVLLKDLLRDHARQVRVVLDRTAQIRLWSLSSGGVALPGGGFGT